MNMLRAIAFTLTLLIGTASSVAQTNSATGAAQKQTVMVFLATYQG